VRLRTLRLGLLKLASAMTCPLVRNAIDLIYPAFFLNEIR
jgi:hypothetical protein